MCVGQTKSNIKFRQRFRRLDFPNLNLYMTNFWYKCFRGFVLGAMLLLAGAANFVCISYDADGDEDTPPVTVELNVVAPSRKTVQTPHKHLVRSNFHSQSQVQQVVPQLLASVDRGSASQLDQGSQQLVVPLRR
jgi:hypothetical protein